MRNTLVAILIALVSTQPAFAGHDAASESKACDAVAKACESAGYTQESHTKMIWQHCMKPILLEHKKVEGVTIDAATASACRTDRIASLKKQLQEFEAAASQDSKGKAAE